MWINVNFLKNERLKMWILWKKWDLEIVNFVKKWDFEIVNFVKNEIFKLWILWKTIVSKCEFLDKLRIFAPMLLEISN